MASEHTCQRCKDQHDRRATDETAETLGRARGAAGSRAAREVVVIVTDPEGREALDRIMAIPLSRRALEVLKIMRNEDEELVQEGRTVYVGLEQTSPQIVFALLRACAISRCDSNAGPCERHRINGTGLLLCCPPPLKQKLGKDGLPVRCHVHHADGVKTHNCRCNLQLLDVRIHDYLRLARVRARQRAFVQRVIGLGLPEALTIGGAW